MQKNSTIDIDNLIGAEFWTVSSKTGKLCRKIVLQILITYQVLNSGQYLLKQVNYVEKQYYRY